jgi:NAD(P)-dependent dehydrogenase (short-subunit alcohol dehydrogenase family)
LLVRKPVIDHGEHSYRGRHRLEGLTALVTDADAGLGRAVAIAFAREGANLGLTHCNGAQGIVETGTWVRKAAPRAAHFECDLTAIEEHARLAERAARELGRIHIVVVNTPFEWLHHADATADVMQLEQTLRTSLETAYQLVIAVAAHMADGGSITLTAPMRCAHPVEPVRALVANAQGITTMAANLAHTLAPKHIRANVLVPGPVRVPRMLERLTPEAAASFGLRRCWAARRSPRSWHPPTSSLRRPPKRAS